MESGSRVTFETLSAAWADDPAFAHAARAGSALLVWDRPGERLLWASPAAGALRDHLRLDEAGRLDPAEPAAARLRALADGLAPRRGMRLERLRFGAGRLDAPVTCACRVATLLTGEEILATVLVSPLPRLGARRPRQALPEAEQPPDAPADPVPETPARLPGRVIRFVWQADSDTRFTAVSPALQEVVGPAGADILGRSWAELGDVIHDLSGLVASHFDRRETWSGRTVHWRVEGGRQAVAVDLAGLPVFDRERRLAGFRGFGLCRPDAVLPWTSRAPDQTTALPSEQPAQPAPEAAREDAGRPAEAEAPGEAPETADASVPPELPEVAPPPGPQPLPSSLHGTVAARLGQDRPAPLRAVEPGEPLDLDMGEALPSAPDDAASPRETDGKLRLSISERSAFREIARALGARYAGDDPAPASEEPTRSADIVPARPPADPPDTRLLDRLPAGVLVHRGETPLYVNRLLLDWTGHGDAAALAAEGGVARLFGGRSHPTASEEGPSPLTLAARGGGTFPVEARLTTVPWDGAPASLMLIRKLPDADAGPRLKALELELRQREARVQELSSILDTATDGVVTLDAAGRILSLNRSAEALFGYDQNEVAGEPITVLLAPESHAAALDYLKGLCADGAASLFNGGREVLGRVRQGAAIPLSMTMGLIGDGPERTFCAVLRDMTAAKKAEADLAAARRAADAANGHKSDLLGRISHEIRTPLNAIIGFTEVMLERRFGAMGNERYEDYLKDIHASGRRVVAVVDDLLDLARIEAGRVELAFTGVSLNALAADAVAQLQPQAARERIVVRTSFAPRLPAVIADERSVRQIIVNLVTNAIRFTPAGGQVIVSTAAADGGEIALRVRDTGVGMTAEEIEAALEPFRQHAAVRRGDGAGLGLPLTKALVEANRGRLAITSARDEGTLVEVLFPPTRVLTP